MLLSKTVLALAVAAGIVAAQNDPQRPRDQRQPAEDQQQTTPRSTTAAESSTLSSQDRAFIQRAAMSGHKEVEAAKMAIERSSSAEVKNLAQRLETDHTATNQELATLAQQKGVDVMHHKGMHDKAETTSSSSPAGDATANKPHKDDKDKAMNELSNVSGDKFDRAWLKHMQRSHDRSIAEFQKASRSNDADVRAFAEKTLPTLRQHLEQIKTVSRSVGNNKTNTTSSSSN